MKNLLTLSLICCLMTPLASHTESGDSREFDPTFVHVVYFWFKNPESLADHAVFKDALTQFMADSKFAKTKFIGVAPRATREVVDDSFTYSLILSFESAEAQNKYQAEAAHQVFVERCKDIWAKVIVYDSVAL